MKRIVMGVYMMVAAAAAQGNEWTASWIGVAEPAATNQWICFRAAADVKSVPDKLIARIACDSKYWLWINGRLAVYEGQIKRGPTPTDTYFDEVDLAPFLKPGPNTFAALVWHFGRQGFSHNNSGKAGFVLEASVDGLALASGKHWKARIHPAYGMTGEPHPNFRLPESNIRFDARLDLSGWTEPIFDDSAWPAAVEFGRPPCPPWNALHPRIIPLWRDFGVREYDKVEERKAEDGAREFVASLPYNAQVSPLLRVRAPAGRTIDIRTDQFMGGSQPSVRAEYITREGEQSHESLGWISGEHVIYRVPDDVEVLALHYRETGYDADFAGAFDCDDPALTTLWKKARRTLYITMRDTYMDCPDRERAQWWGDAVNELGMAFYALDTERGPLLAKKGILEIMRWQREDKTIYSPVPAGIPEVRGGFGAKQPRDGTWSRELPMQMLATVGWYGFWTYYLYTGDEATIREVYPAVRDYLGVWKLGDDGLVIHRTGEWDWPDWGKNHDVPVLENAWLHLALRAAVEMAKLTDHEADIPGYRATMKSIEANFNKRLWRGTEYRSPGYEDATDDRGHAMAVVAGLAEPSKYPAIREVLRRQFEASPYMEKYVLEALYLMDAPEQAVERMKFRWKDQIEGPNTTLWEGWGVGAKGYGGGTINHAWSGGALTLLHQYSAGVEPTEPGFARFRVLPRMGPLRRIETVNPTPRGPVAVDLNRTAERLILRVTVPEGTTALIGIPKDEGRNTLSIDVNETRVWAKHVGYRDAGTVESGKENANWVTFTAPPGEWTWTAEYETIPVTGPAATSPFPGPRGENLEQCARDDLWDRPARKNDFLDHFVRVPRDEVVGHALYTHDNGVLKLSAHLFPLKAGEPREVRLEFQEKGEWKEVARQPVIYPGWTAHFRIEPWDGARRVPYRVRHGAEAVFEGLIREDPKAKDVIVVGSLSCTSNKDRGDRDDIVLNIKRQDPDLLFFAGDQVYDHTEHTASFLLWGRQFREVIRDRPTITIPDDHDIGQGNVWGEGGIVADSTHGNSGGYFYPADYIRMVDRAQTWHLPDPVDPRPIEQNIGVYFTRLRVGGVDFAILEDRKFKSGPKGKIPQMGPRPDHINDPSYDWTTIDLPGLELLGPRQMAFLREWGQDWSGASMKAALSQTAFAGAVHLHGSKNGRLFADLDCNGWPQSQRNAALAELRRALACHLCGDQHLAVVVQHGIDDHRDGPFGFTNPAIFNTYYARWWWPVDEKPGANPIPGSPLPWTGDFFDGLHNRITLHAYANPSFDTIQQLGKVERDPLANRGDGYGLIRFNKTNRTITFECWPRYADLDEGDGAQYTGWPITIRMEDNDGRAIAGHLPEIVVKDAVDPVVQVVREDDGDILYTRRIRGNTFRPPVFADGTYTVKVGRDRPDGWTAQGLRPGANDAKPLAVTIK